MASKRLIYAHRNPPMQYDRNWLATECGNIERAVNQVAAVQLLTIVHGGSTPNPTFPDTVDTRVTVDATNGAHLVDLPLPTLCKGATYTVKKIDGTANVVTVHATIDETLNFTLAAQYASVTVYSDGSTYWKIAST